MSFQLVLPRPRAFGLVDVGQLGDVAFHQVRVTVAVHRHHVRARDDRVHLLHVGEPSAGRAVFHQHVHAVEHHQRRLHHQRKIGNDAVNVLMELAAASAEQAIPVFHRHRGVAEVVVLARRDADDLGRLLERLVEERPVAEDLAVELQRREGAGFRIKQIQIQIVGHLAQAALEKTTGRTVDRVVGDVHPGGAGFEHELGHGAQRFRMGRCRERGRGVERDVRLDHDHVALADETRSMPPSAPMAARMVASCSVPCAIASEGRSLSGAMA